MIVVEMSDPSQLDQLLTADQYKATVPKIKLPTIG